MKKIIVGIFSFILLFSAQSAFAATWNGASNDCPDINIANYTTNDGYGSPCWDGTNINASEGDVINVKVYYHNTGSVTATNTRLKLFAPSGSSTSHSFSAQILSDQGNLYTDDVTVHISSSQTLTLLSTKWYPNQSGTSSSLLNGQSSSAVTSSSGLSIGSIAPGWATQGTINVAFKVSSTVIPEVCKDTSATNYGGPLPCTYPQLCKDTSATNYGGPLPCVYPQKICTISNFSANDYSITQGESSTLNWNTTNCTSATIYPALGSVSTSGSRTVSPTSSTTYTLSASGNGTSDTDTVTINVSIPPQLCKDTSATNYGGPLPCTYPQKICTIDDFSANPTSITSGKSSSLSWHTTNCTSVNIDYVNVTTVGSKIVYPTSTKTYTLRANGVSNSDVDTVTINVSTAPVLVMSGQINSSDDSCVIASGSGSCSIPFSWSTTNPVSISSVTHNGSTVATGNNGSKTFSIKNGSQTYYLYNNGIELDSETVTASCASGSSWNGSYCSPNVIDKDCSINSFYASSNLITQGESSTLSWNTNNCTLVTIYPTIGETNLSGSRTVSPTSSTTYTLNAYGTNGNQTRTVTISVEQVSQLCKDTSATNYGGPLPCTYPNLLCRDVYAINYLGSLPCRYSQPSYNKCTISDFSASDTSIEDGDYTTLSWNTNNCENVKISDIGYVSDDGSKKVSPDEDITYVLTAYDEDGSHLTDSVRIYVDEDDDDDDDDNDCSIDSFTASDTYIDKGDYSTLKWKTTDCDDVSLSGVGDVDDDGSEKVYPYSTTIYTLRAYGDNGSRTKTIRINVGANQTYNPIIEPVQIYNTNVVTTVATNISQTGAQVNGLVTSSDYKNANVYFEYGTTINLGMRTASRSTSGNTNFSDYLTNLSPKTIYYFQAISEGSNGISRGAIEVFQTLGATTTNVTRINTGNNNTNTVVKTVKEVVQGTTVYGSTSPLVLEITNRYKSIGQGDTIDYTVYYKNISSSTLTNPMVQVYVPKGITITNISNGTYSEDERTLSVPIDDLSPGEDGNVYLQAEVETLSADLAQIVTTAILVYTNPNGAQENAMAYVLNNPKNTNSNMLGASAFFSNMFGGLGLIGLLIVIILILLLILIARSLYNKNRPNVVVTETHK